MTVEPRKRAPKQRHPVPLRGAYDTYSAAIYLSLSASQVRQLINDGHLASFVPIGLKKHRYVTRDELDRYIAASVAATQPALEAVREAS